MDKENKKLFEHMLVVGGTGTCKKQVSILGEGDNTNHERRASILVRAIKGETFKVLNEDEELLYMAKKADLKLKTIELDDNKTAIIFNPVE